MKRLPILCIALGLLACGGKDDSAKNKAATDSLTTTRKPVSVNEVLGIAIIEPEALITELSAETGGLIRDVKVNIGDKLTKGQTILVLDNAVESAQLRQATTKIGTQQDAIEAARQNLNKLRLQLTKAQADLQRDEKLFKGNALTQKELEDSRYTVADVQQQINAAEAELKQSQSRITELRADIGYYNTVQGQKTVKAPADGTLLSLDAKVGQYLTTNQSIGEFAPAGPLIALTEIDELFAIKIKVGQKAIIRPQGSNEVLTTGTVVLTSPYLRKKSLFSDNTGNLEDRRVREVRVKIDEPDKVLIGARVECLIQVGNQSAAQP
ncbi:HlyD family secretion protein [Arsenicibacter rosenii]|uniref:Secretion protein HlyD n=1 Tax=Arsenicibacter rosenii TaxID=1750698 RepID=A0A1S2VBF5_9BACT|nr:efflux RND transporter periplasmic adaptor subunit [Arsenicibacter rosenii]OIN56061.1 secretion protein HlyD [Arsenicibacter rosenii]